MSKKKPNNPLLQNSHEEIELDNVVGGAGKVIASVHRAVGGAGQRSLYKDDMLAANANIYGDMGSFGSNPPASFGIAADIGPTSIDIGDAGYDNSGFAAGLDIEAFDDAPESFDIAAEIGPTPLDIGGDGYDNSGFVAGFQLDAIGEPPQSFEFAAEIEPTPLDIGDAGYDNSGFMAGFQLDAMGEPPQSFEIGAEIEPTSLDIGDADYDNSGFAAGFTIDAIGEGSQLISNADAIPLDLGYDGSGFAAGFAIADSGVPDFFASSNIEIAADADAIDIGDGFGVANADLGGSDIGVDFFSGDGFAPEFLDADAFDLEGILAQVDIGIEGLELDNIQDQLGIDLGNIQDQLGLELGNLPDQFQDIIDNFANGLDLGDIDFGLGTIQESPGIDYNQNNVQFDSFDFGDIQDRIDDIFEGNGLEDLFQNAGDFFRNN